ncbi:MAG: ATP-grasp domain-containing protein [Rubrivivax sp.]|nr:ATP-grasp domain-containing protein [Rubrivivax sp.]
MPDFDTVLIANRGEIACRVMRSVQAMGLRAVAVYSDADAQAPHVKLADAAVHIGASSVGESYLRPDKIIAAARAAGAGAIHPGYGFLSENAGFAQAVEAAGLVFIGPPVHAINVMGDKARAKRAMIEAGVPCVPGYQGSDQSDEVLIREARRIGFPLMVKAAAGGGGRGMRLVHGEDTLADAIGLARSEALNAFGSGELILERAIIGARHVELQVFADAHGTVLHFGERDCSVQRRHQKIIEEAPCPVMTPALRKAMGHAAVEAARAVDYRGAGTVEFLLGPDGEFYFLEMNTRLQVEHPVTEAITGLDLVDLQIRVARGEPIGLTQDDVVLRGHAIEVRLYAEDPDVGFLPSTGPIRLWQPPNGAGIRVDAGVTTGGEISPYYDPMVAKIIAYGDNREDARKRLVRALQSTALFGPRTNRDFLIDALQKDSFVRGAATTSFIAEAYGAAAFAPGEPADADLAAAAVVQHLLERAAARQASLGVSPELLDWSNARRYHSCVRYSRGDARVDLEICPRGANRYEVLGASAPVSIVVRELGERSARLTLDDRAVDLIFCASADGSLHLATSDRSFVVKDHSGADTASEEEGGGGKVSAPMHGRLLEIFVAPGTRVDKGQRVAVLEAMKMQHEVNAEVAGTVKTVDATAGAQLAAGDLILEIEPDDAPGAAT